MSSWNPITDFKLLDWGSIPSGAFLYRDNIFPSGAENKRVLYCNLSSPISGGYTPFRFTGAPSNDNSHWNLDVYVDEYANPTYFVRSDIRIELYTDPIDISSLTVGNVPDGTGVNATHQEFCRHDQWDYGLTNTVIDNDFSHFSFQVYGMPSGTYASMRVYLYSYDNSFSSKQVAEIDCTGISQLSATLEGYM